MDRHDKTNWHLLQFCKRAKNSSKNVGQCFSSTNGITLLVVMRPLFMFFCLTSSGMLYKCYVNRPLHCYIIPHSSHQCSFNCWVTICSQVSSFPPSSCWSSQHMKTYPIFLTWLNVCWVSGCTRVAKCDIMTEPLAYFIDLRFIECWKKGMEVGIDLGIQIS
jgi:hypothetical protein